MAASLTTAITTTIVPTATAVVTPTLVLVEQQLTVTGEVVNVRSAPVTAAPVIGAASAGQLFSLTGKDPTGDWWQICCINGQAGWIFGELAEVQGGDALPSVAVPPVAVPPVAVAATPSAPTAPVASGEASIADTSAPTPTPVTAPPVAVAPQFGEGSAGNFDPNAQYQIVHFKVLGLDENNGGIRDSSAQHLILVKVLDAAGNGLDGAVVRNVVGEKQDFVTGSKGPGGIEITM